jgi:hypothetical protein
VGNDKSRAIRPVGRPTPNTAQAIGYLGVGVIALATLAIVVRPLWSSLPGLVAASTFLVLSRFAPLPPQQPGTVGRQHSWRFFLLAGPALYAIASACISGLAWTLGNAAGSPALGPVAASTCAGFAIGTGSLLLSSKQPD